MDAFQISACSTAAAAPLRVLCVGVMAQPQGTQRMIPLSKAPELVPHRGPARAAVAFEQGLYPLPDAAEHDGSAGGDQTFGAKDTAIAPPGDGSDDVYTVAGGVKLLRFMEKVRFTSWFRFTSSSCVIGPGKVGGKGRGADTE
jgi:hypothetical protein